jgi:hypothetical protein
MSVRSGARGAKLVSISKRERMSVWVGASALPVVCYSGAAISMG